MSAPVLEGDSLGFAFGSTPVLRGMTLAVRPGTLFVVTGPNGAGKTTLLRVLAGVLRPHSGSVRLQDQPLDGLSRREVARRIAVVPQETSCPFPFRVDEMVAMGRAPWLGVLGRESAEDRELARDALAELGMLEFAERLYPTLSGGEKQRVLLARARAQRTDLLLLDEPTAHMDLGHRLHTFEWLRGWSRERPESRAALVVTHDLVLGARFADQLALLAQGLVVGQGSPEAVLTEERIGSVYGVEAKVERDSEGRVAIWPQRSRARASFR